MSASVSTDLLKDISLDGLMSVQLNESVLKTNFDVIVKILSALKNDVDSHTFKITNIDNTCAQLNLLVSDVKGDVRSLKEREKEMISSLKNVEETTHNNTTNISQANVMALIYSFPQKRISLLLSASFIKRN